MLKRISAAFVSSVLFVVACTPAQEIPTKDKEGDSARTESDATEGAEEDCVEASDDGAESAGGGGLTPANPAGFDKCACKDGGAARCIPSAAIPASFSKQLDACDKGVCVPDKLVKSGGAAPKTCKSIAGEGRCMNICVPEVGKQKGVLNRGSGDACDADELCVPCLNPLEGNKPTGVCEIGSSSGGSGAAAKPKKKCSKKKSEDAPAPSTGGGDAPATGDANACPYKGKPLDTSAFPACGTGGRCVPATAVSEAQRSRLDTCAGGLCAPEKMVANAGQYLPPTCVSIAGAEGRCLSTIIKDIAAKKGQIPQSTCSADELCAPCFNPADGKETGACSTVSCDKPKEPAKKFTTCCEGKGSCVPTASVSAQQKEQLGAEGCKEGAELCAPTEDITRTTKRPTCNGKLLLVGSTYVGACVSKCTDLGLKGMFLDQATCDGDHVCAPCTDPTSGEPTGACE